MDTEHLKIAIDSDTWESGKRALEKAIWLYLKNPGVSLIDLGFRIRNTENFQIEPELTVRVHLRKRHSEQTCTDNILQQFRYAINAQQIGFAVEVIYASYILNRHSDFSGYYLDDPDLYGGLSLINPLTHSKGTMGGLVQDCKTGECLILSSWHVLSNSWDNGRAIDIIKCQEIADSPKTKITIKTTRHGITNNLDAAVAQVFERCNFGNEQLGIGTVTGVAVPQLGMRVIKSGAGSGITNGIITGLSGYTIQNYNGRKWIVGPTIHIATETPNQKLCSTGDSGAWWLEQNTRRAVGLHFAGSTDSKFGLALAMPDVLEALNIQIVLGQTKPLLLAQSSGISDTDKIVPTINNSNVLISIETTPIATEIETDSRGLIADASDFSARLRSKGSLKQFNLKCLAKKLTTVLNSNSGRILYKLAQLNFLILLSIIVVKYCYYEPRTRREHQVELDRLKNSMHQITAISQVDQKRNFTIDKIIAIINQYNPEMSSDLKIRIANEIYEMSIKYNNLDLELICATITHESGLTWNPRVVSFANARGLMQILPSTAISLAKEEDLDFNQIEEVLFDPIMNIRLGCRYLSSLITAYNIDGGLAAYNGGEKRAEKWIRNGRIEGILHQETSHYVPSILKIYKEYKRMNI